MARKNEILHVWLQTGFCRVNGDPFYKVFGSQSVEDIEKVVTQAHDDFWSSTFVRVTTYVDFFASSTFY